MIVKASMSFLGQGCISPKLLLRLGALTILAWLPALIGYPVVGRVASLAALAESPHPYFVPQHTALLYVWTPLVVVSAGILFLSPGLFLALALGAGQTVGRWVLSGLALSLAVLTPVVALAGLALGDSLRGGAFAALVAACALGCLEVLAWRQRRGAMLAWPFAEPHAAATVLSMVAVPALLLVTLLPKFFWENFNGDGAHAFETARLLLFQPLPFWDPQAGDIASFPGVTSILFAFPAAWFVRLFGEYEASARLPYLLYLPALFGAVIELAAVGRPRSLGLAERALTWLALLVFTLVLAFSATYSPYSADIALPATQDTLFIVCVLGFILSFVRRDVGWLLLFASLSYLSLPTGALLVALWLGAVLLVWRPRPWRLVGLTAAILAGWTVISFLAPPILRAANLPPPGGEYGLLGLLHYLAFLQWSDWRRILFVAVPVGIVPVLSLLLWRRQDEVARALTLVTVAYFLFFFFQAYTVLHHFIPAMVLPLVVFWRIEPGLPERWRPAVLAATAVAGLWAFGVSLPAYPQLDTSARRVGATIADCIGGYETASPAAYRRSTLFAQLFPYDWDPSVPDSSYGGSPLTWNYYAHRTRLTCPAGAELPEQINYVLQRASGPAPGGMRQVAMEDGTALYVRDPAIWSAHQALRPRTPAGSPIYAIPRWTLFRSVPPPAEGAPAILSMPDLLSRLGVDITLLLNRLDRDIAK